MVTRRALLAGVGGGLAASLAGCSDDDPEPGLHATTATVLHRPGDERYRYPEDVAVRAVVENTALERAAGTLVVTLVPATGEREWTEEASIDLSGGTTRSFFVVFEDVADSGDDDFEATATVEPAE